MNTNHLKESPSSNRDRPCFESGVQIAALNAVADDRSSHLLAYAQFLRAKLIANPALEHEPDAPPEKIQLHFATADVTILGSGLKFIERTVQQYELKFVTAGDRWSYDRLHARITSVMVTIKPEHES